jgi:hypothetical protein
MQVPDVRLQDTELCGLALETQANELTSSLQRSCWIHSTSSSPLAAPSARKARSGTTAPRRSS